jgi:hypothetical protein
MAEYPARRGAPPLVSGSENRWRFGMDEAVALRDCIANHKFPVDAVGLLAIGAVASFTSPTASSIAARDFI